MPGWIEVHLTDALGRRWRFFDKPPIFSSGQITKDSAFPRPVAIRVVVLEEGEPLLVSTVPDGVVSEEGEHVFQVPSTAVVRS